MTRIVARSTFEGPTMPNLRALTAVALTLGAIALPACSAAVSPESEAVAESQADLTVVCPPSLACCVSGSAALTAWNLADPFDAQLNAWGCTKPRIYAPTQSANQWWYLSTCADTGGRVETFLANNPKYTQAPYLTTTKTQLDPQCVQGAPQGNTYVLWDPTCSTCTRIL